MTPLYDRIESATGLPSLTPEIADQAVEWFLDRLAQDDVVAALRDVFPDACEEQILAAVVEVSIAVQQP